ncbi:substrate-binding domain-containing protein [Pelobacter propionicus]|uniref:Tungstate ABC transporter permease n=1 Tax=Pelobacter propionicus (strain DSM 2379 / NBRC 103807 / OttBd1) TaxID=338966 RepID=A1AP28_PELPD|nr:substrate-binding domain-containing protein [Pelobacter propionicus]ABK99098.1 tungstate ABC transporter permease [Pelobacter propionicus DSM 2379]
MFCRLLIVLCVFFSCSAFAGEQLAKDIRTERKVVRVAVIGGMSVTTDLWREISRMFEADSGYRVEVVAAGPKHGLADAMRQGRVDLLTMHSSDSTTGLVADGYAVNMRPWARNDLVILGPPSDPARIAGMKDGAQALRKIAMAKANYVELQGLGKREMAHTLWKRAGIVPKGNWYLKDESEGHDDLLRFAAAHEAYVIFGRIPVQQGKIESHNLRILVDKDPSMRRPYIVMEANPELFHGTNVKGARALSDYLLSDNVQKFLGSFGKEKNGGIPFFHPVTSFHPMVSEPVSNAIRE